MKNIIPICFSTNNKFVPYMAVMMQSIMENANRKRKYHFYVLHKEISESYKKKLKKQTAKYSQFSLNFINVNQTLKNYAIDYGRWPPEAFYRLFLSWIFPEYGKVLYFDGDMVCNIDVAELFDIDLKDNLLAGVRDIGVNWYYSPIHTRKWQRIYSVLLNLEHPENYFNSGMIILNLALFRKQWSRQKLLTLATSRKWNMPDQDILNIIAHKKVLLLPFSYNYMIYSPKYFPANLRKEYEQARNNPKILHYKPWHSLIYQFRFELFWKYATRTPFIDIIVNNMQKKYLINNGNILYTYVSKIINVIGKYFTKAEKHS